MSNTALMAMCQHIGRIFREERGEMNEADWLASEDPQAMLRQIDLWNHTDASRAVSDRKLRLFACACCRQFWHVLTDEFSRNTVESAERYADGLITEDELASAARAASVAWTASAASPARSVWAVSAASAAWAARVASEACAAWAASEVSAVQAHLLRDIVGNPFRPVTLPKQQITCPECRGKGDVRRAEIYSSRYNRMSCGTCQGDKLIDGPCLWLTPTVLAIAQSAYEERPERKCEECNGTGMIGTGYGQFGWKECERCHRTGRIEDGNLDPVTLSVLADALEDAGCPASVCQRNASHRRTKCEHAICAECGADVDHHPILANLRSPGPHVRGCWAVDLILGKE